MGRDPGDDPTAASSPDGERRDFSSWLADIAAHVGAADAKAVRALLAEHGCICPESAVGAWLGGETTPTVHKMRQVISALNKALPSVDVWEDYRCFIEGRSTRRTRAVPDVPSLDDLLDRSGSLPRGLLEP